MSEKEEFMRMMRNMSTSRWFLAVQRFFKLFIIFVIIMVFAGNFIVYVRPNEFAIKQVNIGINKGIRKTIYNTGLHLIAPLGVHFMHRFPKNLQVFELTNSPETMAHGVRHKKRPISKPLTDFLSMWMRV